VSAEDLFLKAATALKSSELLLQAGDADGACNRAYYAMFDAARAALIRIGMEDLSGIKTHSGLIAAFSLHLVKTGKAPMELGKSLNKVEDLRLIADYRSEDVPLERARWALDQAQVFVTTLRDL
jgi:uncharacterized protein (UPF0332 family)